MDKWNINSQTATAVARLAVALAVSLLAMFGVEIDGDGIENAVLAVASVAVMAWVWWKNNNVTEAAQEAQAVLDAIRRDADEEREAEKRLAAEAAEEEFVEKSDRAEGAERSE